MKLSHYFCVLTGSLCLLASGPSLGSDLLEHYRSELVDRPAGVFESMGHVFFITEAECLEDKRSAGSQESKRAEANFFEVYSQEVRRRSLTIEASEWSSLPVYTRAEQKLAVEKLGQVRVGYQLLSDSNLESCVRRQVRVSEQEAFVRQSIILSHEDVMARVAENISQWVLAEDFEQLSLQLNSDALVEITALYQALNQALSSPRVNPENQKINGLDYYDINGVLSVVKAHQGKYLFLADSVNESVSNHWLSKATDLFEQGQSPDQIQQFLTLSLNANAGNAESWRMLSNLMRSVSPDDALWVARQQFLTSKGSLESWVYLLKALEINHPQQANQLHQFLKLVAIHWPLSDWEQNQIKG